jgi:hypothetical protein
MPNLSHEQIDRALGIAREGTADDHMWWVDGEKAGSLDVAGLGLAERRRLFQMVRPLPFPTRSQSMRP